jgi:exopolysaccharide production protein ExoZ
MVVFSHAQSLFENYHSRGLNIPGWFNHGFIRDLGGTGVDIFFVISGFVITFTAWNRFQDEVFSREFLIRRLIRIVPMYWLCTSVMAVTFLFFPQLIFSGRQTSVGHVLASYLFIPWAQGDDRSPVLGAGWSLNYEMFFYVVFALSLFLPRKKALLRIVVGLIAIIGVSNWITLTGLSSHFWFFSNSVILEFIYGMVLATLFQRGLSKSTMRSLFLLAFGSAALALIVFRFGANLKEWRGVFWGGPSALIMAGAMLLPTTFKIPTFLVRLGDISYSLYLVHFFCQVAIGHAWLSMFSKGPVDILVILLIVVSCVVAYFAHVGIERPSNDWLLRKYLAASWRVKVLIPPTAPSAPS